MLTRLIVVSYVLWVEIVLWLVLILAGVWGYYEIVPIMDAAGAVVSPEFVWRILGALLLADKA